MLYLKGIMFLQNKKIMSLKPKVLLAISENLYLNESICHTLIEKNIEKKAIKSIVEKK